MGLQRASLSVPRGLGSRGGVYGSVVVAVLLVGSFESFPFVTLLLWVLVLGVAMVAARAPTEPLAEDATRNPVKRSPSATTQTVSITGRSTSFHVTVMVNAPGGGVLLWLAACGSATADPDPFNNVVAGTQASGSRRPIGTSMSASAERPEVATTAQPAQLQQDLWFLERTSSIPGFAVYQPEERERPPKWKGTTPPK